MSDWNNDYSGAGPGTKRRLRAESQALQEIPQSSERKKRTKTKPARERLEREWRDASASEIKAHVMALTLAGNDPRQILAALEEDNIRATLLTIGNLNRQYRETIKLLRSMGLINETRLARYLDKSAA